MKTDRKVSRRESRNSVDQRSETDRIRNSDLDDRTLGVEVAVQESRPSRSSLVTRRRGETTLSADEDNSQAVQFETQQWEQVFNTVTNGIRVIDLDHRTLYVNDAFCHLAGIGKQEALGRLCYEALPGDACHSDRCPLARIARGEQHVVYETEKVERLGNVQDCSITATPLTDKSGSLVGIVEELRETSSHTQTEAELGKQRQDLQIIIDSAPFMIFYKDRENRFIKVNDVLARAARKTKDQIEGRTAFEIVPDHADEYWKDDLEVIELGVPKLNIVEEALVDGETRWYRTDKIPYRDSTGNIVGILGFSQDITERKLAEVELRQSEEKFQKAFVSSPESVTISQVKDGRLIEVNDGAVSLMGYSRDELLGATTLELDLFADPKDRERLINKMTDSGGSIRGFQVAVRSKSGEIRDCSVSADVITLNGEPHLLATTRDITERKRATEEILRNKILLESSLESQVDTIILSLDREYRYLYFNNTHSESMKNVYGTRPELGMCLLDVMKGDADIAKVKAHYDRALAGERHSIIEDYGDGDSRLFFDISYNPIYDSDQEIIGLSAFARDITDQKLVEQALIISEEKYRSFVEGTDDLIAQVDVNGVITYANHASRKMYGLEPKDCIGRLAFDFVHPDDHESTKTAFADWVSGKDKWSTFENRLVSRDGTIRHVAWSIGSVLDCDGNLTSINGIGKDITVRKAAEYEFRLHSVIMKNLAEGVYLVGAADGIIRCCNPKFEEMFGYDPGEMIGKHASIVNKPTDSSPEETTREIMEALAETGEWRGEIENIRKDGTSFWCHASCSVLEHSDFGKVIVAVHNDITERKQTDDALRASDAKLREKHTQLIEGQLALEGKNTALSELILHVEREKKELAVLIRNNMDRVVGPVLARLEARLDESQIDQLAIIRSALNDMTDPFIDRLEHGTASLTAREIEICNLIKSGYSSKDVARTLSTSESTVKTQRKIIRRKLGLINSKDNLATYLKQL